MSKLNIKTGDNVLVITGKDKGKQGLVKQVNVKNSKVIVESVFVQTKCKKARNAQQKSEIIKREGEIEISNVQVVCPVCGKATRIARREEANKSVRVCKKCGAVIDGAKKSNKKTAKKVEAKVEKSEVVNEEKVAPAKKETKSTTEKKSTTKKTAPKA